MKQNQKIISVLTATRAEYGLLKPIIKKLKKIDKFDVRIAATGMHLSQEFGMTYKEIEADGNIIDEKIEILLSSDSETAISKSMGLAMLSFADYFERLKPDMLIVLGDRYEVMAVCCAASNMRIPIAHLCGGETTEGAVDECFRHSITKMSYLHFTGTEEYRRRVIQLGEDPNRVFNFGSLGVEIIQETKLLTKEELEASIQFKLDRPFGVVTFHPVTLEEGQVEQQCKALLEVCAKQKDMKFIFTKANADAGGRIINRLLEEYVEVYDNGVLFSSLGMLRYLSTVSYSEMVIGNSSSGIAEVPAFKIPTINIGDRQKGRIQAASVITCEPTKFEIENAFEKARNKEFRASLKNMENPYGNGQASENIVKVIETFLKNKNINLKKKFYDI